MSVWGVFSVLALGVLLFGLMQGWAFYGVAALALGLVCRHVGRAGALCRGKEERRVLLWGMLLLGVGAVQLFPLPTGLLRWLSPTTLRVLEDLSGPLGTWRTPSLYGPATEGELLRLSAAGAVMLLVAGLGRRGAERLMVALVVFGGALSLLALLQRATAGDRLYWLIPTGGSPYGPYVNPNHFAALAGMLLPLGLALAARDRTKAPLYVLLSALLGLALLGSASRGAMAAALVSLLLLVIMLPLLRPYAVAFAGLLGLYILLWPGQLQGMGEVAGALKMRLGLWADVLRAFGDFPLLGTGLGTFRYVFPLYATVESPERFLYAHSEPLQLLLEAGLLGALAAGGFVALAARLLLRGPREPLRAGLAAGWGFALLHSLGEFNLHAPANTMMFAALTGLGLSLRQKDGRLH